MTKQTEAELLHEICEMVLDQGGLLSVGRQPNKLLVSVDISLPSGKRVFADKEELRPALEHCLRELS